MTDADERIRELEKEVEELKGCIDLWRMYIAADSVRYLPAFILRSGSVIPAHANPKWEEIVKESESMKATFAELFFNTGGSDFDEETTRGSTEGFFEGIAVEFENLMRKVMEAREEGEGEEEGEG